MEPVQLFVPRFRVEECLAEISECLQMGWTGLGYKTLQIEQRWAEYSQLPHAHFVSSATAALHMALVLLKQKRGWRQGDEVISTPLTFVSTNHTILQAGLKPVFADVDEYLCLSPESVEALIGPRTRAVMFVGLGGNTGRLEEIARICKRNGLALILDAAHMAGTKLDGRDPGWLADAACYSFQAVKNLPTADSGMLCFADAELDAAVRKLSWLGISKDTFSRAGGGTYAWQYDVDYVGFKYHGNSVMAALALVGLKYLDEDNAFRHKLANTYQQLLEPLVRTTIVPVAPGCLSSRHLFQVIVEDRERVIRQLHEDLVFPGVHYRINTDYPMYAYGRGACPAAEEASKRVLSLPMHLNLSDADLLRVARTLENLDSDAI